jgi:alkaline phosphatase
MTRYRARAVLLLFLLLNLTACSGPDPQESRPVSVIVLVPDGGGVAHWTLAQFAAEAMGEELAVREMPVAGLVHTRGWDHEVTGSAAAATALATGTRTFVGAVGVGPDSLPRTSSLQVAHERGWATGLITTAWVTDATPAALSAHVPDRSQMVEIFRQMTDLPVDVILGGGQSIFQRAFVQDSVDLRPGIEERYDYVESPEALTRAAGGDGARVLGLFAPGSMPRVSARTPSLVEMTRAALQILERDPDGFFLLVENEGVDTEFHANAERHIVEAEMLDLDAAVRVALDFREEHPGTLVLVVADHETGGVTLNNDDNRDIVLGYSTTYHTAAFVPLFAVGPGAERFGGILDNDEVGRILKELVGAAP